MTQQNSLDVQRADFVAAGPVASVTKSCTGAVAWSRGMHGILFAELWVFIFETYSIQSFSM
jgi:hypothetical protein